MSFIIPQADPKAGYLAHGREINAAMQAVLNSGRYILGKQVELFEQEFAASLGAAYAVGTASGTEALELALRVCGIGRGDAVLTVSHTAVATVAAIELAGAIPLLVDIDPATFTLDADCLQEAIRFFKNRYRLKAIIPVHLYGHPADMPKLKTIADKNKLSIIEDCAQSHGATLNGRNTGTWGRAAAFSFYPTKNLSALGDAGALVTDDPALARRARQIREYGWQTRYISRVPGMNTRLDELQAAVLRVKLRYLKRENASRCRIAKKYDALLAGLTIKPPPVMPGAGHVFHQYVIRSSRRDRLKDFMLRRGVATAIHYPVPVHLQPAYRKRALAGRLKNTEKACKEILSLPMHPYLTDKQVKYVGKVIVDFGRFSARKRDV